MAVQKQSRLDAEGIKYRKEVIPGKNRYADEINPYDGDNEDALAHDDKEHPWGKGTGTEMSYAIRDLSAPKTKMNYSVLNTTENAGGSYDKFGTQGVDKAFQGESGREWAKRINPYSSNNAYGQESVDIDLSVRGQFFTK